MTISDPSSLTVVDGRCISGCSSTEFSSFATVEIFEISQVNKMAVKRGSMIPSDRMMTVTKVAAGKVPLIVRRHPIGSTPTRTAGHTFIMMAVHGSVARIQSSIRPELA